MVELYNGVSVDYWAQDQTLNPPPNRSNYSLWDEVMGNLRMQWYDLCIPEIPLDIRFKNFQKRLKQCCDKHGFEYRG